MLTLEYLKNLKIGTIFKSGYFAQDGKKMRWIAIKVDVCDWTIYHDYKGNPDMWIYQWGDKVQLDERIKKLVPCTDEVFKMYKYDIDISNII